MKKNKLFVFDVNTLVSAFLIGSHTNAKAFDKARSMGKIICSHSIEQELIEVFSRKKFDKYIPFAERMAFLSLLLQQLIQLPQPVETITACRDPKDNKYLELAVDANASCIITGDKDLLALHPFRTIPVLDAADFLNGKW